MEDKNTTPVDKKNTKKPTGKSATGKPLDVIDVNPQLNVDGQKHQKNESVVALTDTLNEKAALTIAQRQKRARILRSRESKMQRARETSRGKLASKQKLEARALAAARNRLKARYATRRGVAYTELSTAEKIEVDKKVANKQQLIRKLAARLLPKIQKAEFERLKSFKTGAPLQNLATTKEDFSGFYEALNDKSDTQLISIIESSINALDLSSNPMGTTLRRMLTAVVPSTPINETLLKKAEITGIPFSTLKEVFERGAFAWDEGKQTQEQFAFNRVNSYIAGGRAWKLDADLREEREMHEELNESFAELLEKTGLWDNIHAKRERIKRGSGERMRKPGSKGAPTAQNFKDAQESVVPHVNDQPEAIDAKGNIVAGAKRHGNVRYVGVRTQAHKETGTQERQEVQYIKRNKANVKKEKDADPQQIRIAQDQIKKKVIDEAEQIDELSKDTLKSYMKKAPGDMQRIAKNMKFDTLAKDSKKVNNRMAGMNKAMKKVYEETATDLNESFGIAFAAGIGTMLDARDLGMKIKPAFEHHPDVIAAMEDVKTADKEPVIEPAHTDAYGNVIPAKTVMRKSGRKIIKSGNVHDGETS